MIRWGAGCSRVVVALAILATGTGPGYSAGGTTETQVSMGAKPCVIESLERPYVLVNADRLSRLRKDLAAPGNGRARYELEIRNYAESWLGREVTIPPRAGHYHHFTCDDGTRLETPSDFIFRSNAYKCPSCGRVYSGEKYDGGRRNAEHGWLVRAARSCAIVYALEQDLRYAARAAEILRKYADAYPAVGRHTSTTEGGIFFQSLDESMNMILLAQAYDLVYDSGALSDADKQHIERDLFWESAEGIKNMGIGGNWGSWHLSAVGVIGLATRHQRFIEFGVESFKSQMVNQLGADGLWPESVHTYHFFPLMAFVDFAEAAANAGIPLWSFEGPDGRGLRRMFSAPVQFMYPNLQLPAINDGWFNSYMPADLYTVAYSRLRMPEFAWIVKKSTERESGKRFDPNSSRTSWEVLYGDDLADSPLGEPPKLISTDFPVLGIAVLRAPKSDVTITFDYGKFLGHGQADKMGFTVFANNRLLVADYGTPSYGSSILSYYTGTASHNTIMIDGENQKRTKTGKLDVWAPIETSGRGQCVAASTDEAYPGTSWTRVARMMPSESVIISDDLRSTVSRQYDWLLHCEGDKLELQGVEDAECLPVGKTPSGFTDLKWRKPTRKDATVAWHENGGALLSARIDTCPGMIIGSGRCPAETGTRTIPVLILRQVGLDASFRVVLETKGERTSP